MKQDNKYRQLAIKLKCDISSGVYRVGDAIPSQLQLGTQFGVSQITVRKAVDLLEQEGYIRKGNGRGNGSVVLERSEDVTRRRLGYNFGAIGRPYLLDSHRHDLPAVANGIIPELAKWDAGFSIMPFLSDNFPSSMSFVHSIIEKNLVDGFFIFDRYDAAELCAFLASANIPFVRVVTFCAGLPEMLDSSYPVVAVDEEFMFRELLSEARQRGCKRVVLLAAPEDLLPSRTHAVLAPILDELQLEYRMVEAEKLPFRKLCETTAEVLRPDTLVISSTPLLPKIDICLSLSPTTDAAKKNLIIYQHYADMPEGLTHKFRFIKRPFERLGSEAAVMMKQLVELKSEGKPLCQGQHIIIRQYLTKTKEERNEFAKQSWHLHAGEFNAGE